MTFWVKRSNCCPSHARHSRARPHSRVLLPLPYSAFKGVTHWSPGQDGGVGRNPLLPPTTKSRIRTNLKSINNQKHQKINWHGTPTIKELKKKSTRTIRLVRTHGKAADRALGWGQLKKTVARRWAERAVWLKVKLRLRADCGLQRQLLQWEKLHLTGVRGKVG